MAKFGLIKVVFCRSATGLVANYITFLLASLGTRTLSRFESSSLIMGGCLLFLLVFFSKSLFKSGLFGFITKYFVLIRKYKYN